LARIAKEARLEIRCKCGVQKIASTMMRHRIIAS
jgi:hypothetical protein